MRTLKLTMYSIAILNGLVIAISGTNDLFLGIISDYGNGNQKLIITGLFEIIFAVLVITRFNFSICKTEMKKVH